MHLNQQIEVLSVCLCVSLPLIQNENKKQKESNALLQPTPCPAKVGELSAGSQHSRGVHGQEPWGLLPQGLADSTSARAQGCRAARQWLPAAQRVGSTGWRAVGCTCHTGCSLVAIPPVCCGSAVASSGPTKPSHVENRRLSLEDNAGVLPGCPECREFPDSMWDWQLPGHCHPPVLAREDGSERPA